MADSAGARSSFAGVRLPRPPRPKRDFRALWITRINAACMIRGIRYSQFMHGLKLAQCELNRKMLSELAIHNPTVSTKSSPPPSAREEGRLNPGVNSQGPVRPAQPGLSIRGGVFLVTKLRLGHALSRKLCFLRLLALLFLSSLPSVQSITQSICN